MDIVKILCSFINPQAAATHFAGESTTVENSGFLNDLKAIDPKFDNSKYQDFTE